jgi:hypothetical protein
MGPIGDNYGFRDLLARRPDWRAVVLELNSGTNTAEWDGERLRVTPPGGTTFAVEDVGTVVFLPVCLEIEETLLSALDPSLRWPRFAAEQWRPISALFEARLDGMHCLNRPGRVRATNNKLMQHEALRRAGFALPPTRLAQPRPYFGGPLVAKNVSEGGWKSAEEFSPARLVHPGDPVDPWPALWQTPIPAERELRVYVMGDDVVTVELRREPGLLDVRTANAGRPAARVIDLEPGWRSTLVAMTRALGLDYAVIDALPSAGELHVLEVNANGVWWFLPPDVGAFLRERFHAWIEREVDGARTGAVSARTDPSVGAADADPAST